MSSRKYVLCNECTYCNMLGNRCLVERNSHLDCHYIVYIFVKLLLL